MTQAIYFSHWIRHPESHLTLNEWNIPFIKHVKHLSGITWRLRTETIEAKPFRTFIRTYSLFKSERLSANITLTPPPNNKAVIRSVMTYVSFTWELDRLQRSVPLQRAVVLPATTIGLYQVTILYPFPWAWVATFLATEAFLALHISTLKKPLCLQDYMVPLPRKP
jgi:hypothetical protein